MKHKLYNTLFTLFAICFLGTVSAQKFDKKFTENFKVNKDVEVAINASNTTINVTTWNKKEVQIEAFIEIEGLSKEDAEKYFKEWNFEALGNSKTVKITSKGNFGLHSKKEFIFFNDMNFEFSDIELPNIETIVIPDVNFDFNFDFDYKNIFEDLDDLDKNLGKNGKYSFEWDDGEDKISIKSKKDWEAFKKTKKYKELKKEIQVEKIKVRKEFLHSKEKMKKELEKAKHKLKKINKEEIKREIEIAKEHIMKIKLQHGSNSNDISIDGKKVKIKKRLEIKVPKGATFNLNTRHCKVKLPNTVASGTVKYGTFDALNLNGGKLKIDFSPVNINNLNAATLFLNNVTDAKIASVTNTDLSNNSSGVHIIRINENVTVSDKFGKLSIDSFYPNFGEFTLNVNNSDVALILGDVNSKFKYHINKVKLDNKRTKLLNKNNTENNLIKINGDYSSIVIK
jgi:hypothetical protein